jgi:DNA-binding IclR family transcriptional regulator
MAIMSKTLIRGLGLIQEVDLHGPLTLTELSRRLGMHITIASRTVGACEEAGWLTRIDGKISVGPRSALLGLASPLTETVRRVEPLVQAISGICGVATAATGLICGDVMILASAGAAAAELPAGLSSRSPIHVMAAGRAIAVQLSAPQLDAILPPEPFPSAQQVIESLAGSAPMRAYLQAHETSAPPVDAIPQTRDALDTKLDAIRSEGFARDYGELHPSVNCIAAPWPALTLPASLACFATRGLIESNRDLIEACLRAATTPGASAQDVVRAAAKPLA